MRTATAGNPEHAPEGRTLKMIDGGAIGGVMHHWRQGLELARRRINLISPRANSFAVKFDRSVRCDRIMNFRQAKPRPTGKA